MGDAVEVGELGFVGGFLDEVADQVDGAELGIGHVDAGRVRQEVEHGAMPDRPTDGVFDRLQELIELPLMGAKGRDAADGGTHRNLDEARGIDERLRRLLLGDDVGSHVVPTRLVGNRRAVSRIEAADPAVALIDQTLGHLNASFKPVTVAL